MTLYFRLEHNIWCECIVRVGLERVAVVCVDSEPRE